MTALADRRANAIRTRNKPATPGAPFQSELEKAQPGGYASLGDTALIPASQLGTGAPGPATALFGDQTFKPTATSADLAAETAARLAADTTLQTNITNEATTRANANTTEATARAAGDALALQKASNLSDVANAGTSRTNLGLGTAATKDVPAAGNASVAQVVKGDDTRLSDSRAPSGSASGDLSGTYPSPTVKSAAAQFVVNGRTDSTTGILQSIFADNAARSVGFQSEATRTVASTHVQFINPNGVIGSISTSGSTTTYATSSDKRLKTPIRILTESSVISQITVREFEREGEIEYGVFAQELYKLLVGLGLETKARHVVHVGSNHKDKQGRLRNPWGVDFSALVPDLILECQSLRRAVVALEARVATLTPGTP